MREHLRHDGAVVLTSDGDDPDQVVVEGVVIAFTPIRGNVRCVCGAHLQPWNLRHVNGGAEFNCYQCHRVHGHLGLGVRIHR
jgi:hypothetical protein